MFHYCCLGLLLIFSNLGSGLLLPAYADTSFTFAVIGDLPYGVHTGVNDNKTQALIDKLNANKNLAWVLHIGDIKTGIAPCTDEFLTDRAQRFRQINVPFILTPGDNEWTDCHRITAGGFDPLERLTFLRNLFYRSKQAEYTRKKLAIHTQPQIQAEHKAFIENYFWQKNGVYFATMHIVGSQNGKLGFSKLSRFKRSAVHDDEVTQREKAALAWLTHTFTQAQKNHAKALFLAIHANPGLGNAASADVRAFQFFTKALRKALTSFDKPVVLAHGDSHYFRLDKPKLAGAKAPLNFLRLESFGENNNAWVNVEVRPESEAVFYFSPHSPK